jgi:hypothetical protein
MPFKSEIQEAKLHNTVAGMKDTYYRVEPGSAADATFKDSETDVEASANGVDPAPTSFSINLKSFVFQNAVAPGGSISGTFNNETVYVTKENIRDLAHFTMVVLGTIDQIPAPSAPGSGSASGGH